MLLGVPVAVYIYRQLILGGARGREAAAPPAKPAEDPDEG